VRLGEPAIIRLGRDLAEPAGEQRRPQPVHARLIIGIAVDPALLAGAHRQHVHDIMVERQVAALERLELRHRLAQRVAGGLRELGHRGSPAGIARAFMNEAQAPPW
jgi:hypothetical protein